MTTVEPKAEQPSFEAGEREWFEKVYRGMGDTLPQFTWRATLMGALLGCVMSLTNIYIGLKTGWALGVAITSCILSFSIVRGLHSIRLMRSELNILETNCMQSTATAAGVSVGGTMISAIAAMMMITGKAMDFWVLFGWNILLAVIGITMSVPMKRQMINREQLRFPSGTAAAVTLRSLYSAGAGAMQKARALGVAGLLGALVAWVRDATFRFMPWNMPASLPFGRLAILGTPLTQLTMKWDMGLIMIGAGAIMSFKVGWSLLLGACVNYLVLCPIMIHQGVIVAGNPQHGFAFRDLTKWSLWIGASMMVVSSFVPLAFQAKTIGRSLKGLAGMRSGGGGNGADPLKTVEVPQTWFWTIFLVALVGVVTMQRLVWHIQIWMGVLSVLLTFVLAVVACRATGETDTTPVGPLGKVTQLTYGILAPSSMTTNIMTASATANASGCSADMLTNLKCGYLLGANSRQQFLAQMMGILPGAIIVGVAWKYLVPDPSVLGGDKFPAPAAMVWKGVAELLSKGVQSLHPTARIGALCGGLVGLALPLLDHYLPERFRKFVPSAMGLGLAFVIQGFNCISMFVGAFLALMIEKLNPKAADTYTVPVASGLIAGESLMAIIITVMIAVGVAAK
ncbi:MAG TPA: OPT family oligopeptide transporter [Candidatus Saccharimonadales bacterium]|nr:OPT family oligopeptide transporter [Candidatus Saccharimonadales bacterium]